jgi:hypothetical protein
MNGREGWIVSAEAFGGVFIDPKTDMIFLETPVFCLPALASRKIP